jgi:hypothetical protein
MYPNRRHFQDYSAGIRFCSAIADIFQVFEAPLKLPTFPPSPFTGNKNQTLFLSYLLEWLLDLGEYFIINGKTE